MVLVTNAIAILSEDRFLARIGWSASSASEPAFGGGAGGDASVKSKIVNLIASVRTLMRSTAFLVRPYLGRWSKNTETSSGLDLLKATANIFSLVPLIGINMLVIVYELVLG